jgi:hypothetical protein
MSIEDVRNAFEKFKMYMETVEPEIGKNIDVDKMVETYMNPAPKSESEPESHPIPEPYEPKSMFDFLFQRTVIDVPSWVVLAVSVIVRVL